MSGNLDRMMQSQQDRAQQLRKWRESRLHEETLPSGLQVLLRDVDIASLAIEGDVPNTLLELITSEEFQKSTEEEATQKILGEHKASLSALLFQVAKAALVDPAIGDVADNHHILYSELSFDDRITIMNFMNREAKDLRPFREGTTELDEASQPGRVVRFEAE